MPTRPIPFCTAVILAAGQSSRMGRPKALLPWKGKTILENLLEAYAHSKVQSVLVVGNPKMDLQPWIHGFKNKLVINPNPDPGPLSSVWIALDSLSRQVEAILLHPVDAPVFSSTLLDALVDAHADSGKDIVVPIYQGRRGHPVLMSKNCFEPLRRTPLEVGARHILQEHPDWILELPTTEPGVRQDLNTPLQWEDFVRNAGES